MPASPEKFHTTLTLLNNDGRNTKSGETFKYLGSTDFVDNRADNEISSRMSDKYKKYRAMVIPALLYSTETYLYAIP